MLHRRYNEGFKEAAVKKLLSPGSLGLKRTAHHLGVPSSTLFEWKVKYANKVNMKQTKKLRLVKDWTSEEKLGALLETAKMSENELGKYLRANGLHSSDLESFKHELLSSSTPSRGRPKLDPEVVQLRKDVKILSRDLNKKDKALAEMSARVILLKKSRLLWGEPEDEE